MLEFFFETPFTLKRLRSGFAGPFIDGFAGSLKDLGYSWWVSRRFLRGAAHFGRYVEVQEGSFDSLTGNVLEAFRQHLRSCICPDSNGGKTDGVVRGAELFLNYLEQCGVVNLPQIHSEAKSDPAEVEDFRHWLRQHRGASESTIYRYSRAASDLMGTLGDDGSTYDAQGLRQFVLDRARVQGPGAIKSLISGLRMFLRYLASQKKCRSGLNGAIPAVACWRLATLPTSLSVEDVNRILDTCDAVSPIGLRDRAMILVLARLGLRAGDVAALRLDDINWTDGSIVVSGKSRRQVRLPLPQDVGEAILAYLDHRPLTEAREVFLCSVAPYRGFCNGSSASQVVVRAMHRAGITAPRYGAHQLRHTAATEMLRRGVSLYDIGSVLRHRSADMSAYYAKVDIELLKQVVQPWPEVLSC